MRKAPAKRQQSAKPKGNSTSRAAVESDSEASSNSGEDEEEDDEDAGTSEEEGEEDADSQGSSADSDGSEMQFSKSPARQRRSSSQQDGDEDYESESDSPMTRQQSQGSMGAQNRHTGITALQQQQQMQPAIMPPAAGTAAGPESALTLQQMAQQHTEHMHVAVRARPVPAGSSSSCWSIDSSAATVTLNGSQSAAKRKQAQYGSNALRSSNSNGLDGGLSRGLLGTAPSTPGIGSSPWDGNGMSGTSMGYKFDQVLDEEAETAAVYSSCIQSLVHSALEGINGTVLAYGECTLAAQLHLAWPCGMALWHEHCHCNQRAEQN